MERIGAAVIGAGIYGEVHCRTYCMDSRVELLTVWSRSSDRASAAGRKYGCGHTTDLDAIAGDPRIKIVSVATPDFAHTLPAVKMLEAGKHVLCEKPLAVSVQDCQNILHARDKGGGKLMVNFHNRWYPPVAEVKKQIDKGTIGVPVTIFARLSDRIEVPTRWLSWAGQSGPEWFLLPHIVDLAGWFAAGRKPTRVFGTIRKGVLADRGIACPDAVQAIVEFGDIGVCLEANWILPDSWRNIIDFKIDVVGSKGKIGIVGDREGIEIASDVYRTPFVLDPITEEEPIRYFIDCILSGYNPVPSGEDGLFVTRIIEAVVSSAKQGKAVDL